MTVEPVSSGIVYASFDVFPAPKGAAVHIRAFAEALAGAFGSVDLVTPAAERAPVDSTRPWLDRPAAAILPGGIRHHGLDARGKSLLSRAMDFRAQLRAWWGDRCPRVAHVRSIFEGYPLAVHKGQRCERLVYEVNGLPSIELKYHYPDVAEDDELLHKLRAQEDRCLQAADLLITPSAVTRDELVRRGVAPGDVEVINNGVNERLFAYRDPPSWQGRTLRLLYVGTMTTWQGVHHALEAVRLLRRDHPTSLTLVGPARRRQQRDLAARCDELGIAEHVRWLAPMDQAELVEQYHHADVALVPLPANDRNTVQGCCPLKLLEAMACGVPVVASALPVVTDLARPDVDVVTVKPGSGKAIKDGVVRLLADPGWARQLTRSARSRIEHDLTWRHAGARLVDCYRRRIF